MGGPVNLQNVVTVRIITAVGFRNVHGAYSCGLGASLDDEPEESLE